MLKLLRKWAGNDNSGEISYFDVKELYDAAFAEKNKARVNLKKFKILMTQAEKMDAAYRVQLGLRQSTQDYKRAA